LSKQTQIALEDKAKGIQDEREMCNNKMKLYQEKHDTVLRQYQQEIDQLRKECHELRATRSGFDDSSMHEIAAERDEAVHQIESLKFDYNKLVARLKTTEEQLVAALKKAPRNSNKPEEQGTLESPKTDPSQHVTSANCLQANGHVAERLRELHNIVMREAERAVVELEMGIDLTKNLLGESRATQLLDKILEERKGVFRDIASKCQENYDAQANLLQRFVGGYMTPHDLECATSALLRNEIEGLKTQHESLSQKSAMEHEKYVELAYAIDQDKQAWREENDRYEATVHQLDSKNKQLEALLAEAHRNEFRWNSHR